MQFEKYKKLLRNLINDKHCCYSQEVVFATFDIQMTIVVKITQKGNQRVIHI